MKMCLHKGCKVFVVSIMHDKENANQLKIKHTLEEISTPMGLLRKIIKMIVKIIK